MYRPTRGDFKSSSNLLVLFTGLATVNKQMYIDILRRFKDAVKRKRPEKNGEQTVGFYFTTCSSAAVGFGRGFLDKEQCDDTRASLAQAAAYFYMFCLLKSALNERRFRDAMSSLRMRRKS